MGTRISTIKPSTVVADDRSIPDSEVESEGAAPAWSPDRWATMLDRIEHRQSGLGLKFWGPPLWLEVTMTGPDSDQWPANPGRDESWNWQSVDTCAEAEDLMNAGADDDQVLQAAGCYTIENLILNAVHEIGEWFRFDGQRVFPAHPSSGESPPDGDGQGNGSVKLAVTFSPATDPGWDTPGWPPIDELGARRQLKRLNEVASASRFTYLPGTAVQHHAAGPVVRGQAASGPPTEWRARWSTATLDAVQRDTDAEALIVAVQRDVHGALVAWEADRICRAFHIDGLRPWRLAAPEPPLGSEPPDLTAAGAILSATIDYTDLPVGTTGPEQSLRHRTGSQE